MDVNAGELDKRIQIVKRTKNRDADGYDRVTETVVRRCWASFTQKSGTEMQRENADFGEQHVRFLVRYTPTPIDRKMFVRYKGGDYEIEYINGYGDSHEYIELWCKWQSQEVAP